MQTRSPQALPPKRTTSWLAVYAELGKLRLGSLVVLTAIVGYALGVREGFSWLTALALALGTLLAAAGANTLNQWLEVERDARMHRTRTRPLPTGRITRRHAVAAALGESVLGTLLLALACNLLTAVLALAVILLYALVYTPLKPRSSLNTLVGAVCGAVPPMMGWAAARGSLDAGAWVLAATLFVWQIPHFLALAWLYREDYVRGGYRMLPISDPSGAVTCWMALLYSLALVPVGLAATAAGMAGWVYAIGAVVLGGLMIERTVRLLRRRTDRAARHVFWASLAYLPLLLGLMVIDAHPASPRADAPPATRSAATLFFR
ncbi:MAG: heme o synthase [Acidobacteriota bacterium]|nr:heme o synthase [Acidobacteriota bacterium]MDQ7087961.1 heme o synthase [Acidobacteriota bacterium]